MDRTERFYKIDQMLQRAQGCRSAAAGALGVSRAQLKRDLAYMRERLTPPSSTTATPTATASASRPRGPRYGLPGLWFSADEIHALLTMQHLLENLQPGLLTPHVKPLLRALAAILGSADHSQEEVARRVRVLHQARASSAGQFRGGGGTATLKRRRLKIRHYNRLEDRETERVISPQRLVHYRDNWYVDAWCHLRNDLRSFAVDAIAPPSCWTSARRTSPGRPRRHNSGYGIFAGSKVPGRS